MGLLIVAACDPMFLVGRPLKERVDSRQVVIEEALIVADRKLAAVICSAAPCSFQGDLALAPEHEDITKAEGSR